MAAQVTGYPREVECGRHEINSICLFTHMPWFVDSGPDLVCLEEQSDPLKCGKPENSNHKMITKKFPTF